MRDGYSGPTGDLPPPPMTGNRGPRTYRVAIGADAAARVFAAALIAAPRMAPSERLSFAKIALHDFRKMLDETVA